LEKEDFETSSLDRFPLDIFSLDSSIMLEVSRIFERSIPPFSSVFEFVSERID